MMKTSIFISRSLNEQSPLSILDSAKYEVFAHSMIKFQPIPITELPQSDWIFFYSKTAVKYFFDQFHYIQLPEQTKIACIGNATAKSIYSITGQMPHFVASPELENSKKAFLTIIHEETVLFPRALQSRKTFQKMIPSQQVIDLILYKNEKVAFLEIPTCDILVFTSPLNFGYYQHDHLIYDHQTIIAIGNTTASCIREQISNNVLIPDEPSEEAIKSLIESL